MSGSSLKVQHIGNTFGFAASSLAFELVDELQHIDVNKIYQELSCKDGSLASFPKGENDVSQAKYNLGRNESTLNSDSMYQAASYTIRSYLLDKMNKTKKKYREQSVKRCYYLSMEFLMGRAMQNAIVNIDCEESFRKALLDLGYELEDLYELECDAGLGNGGLGRLAACFLDSFSTLNLPVWGYGIRFQYGIFQQKIENGWQKEYPDYWLQRGYPWEIYRPDVSYLVQFGGKVERYFDSNNIQKSRWVEGKMVKAIAYDNPIPGYKTETCNNLRLWRCVPLNEFDFDAFDNADYFGAKKEKDEAEAISSVLYPNDNDYQGKLLRLKQEYFFVSASLQDALRRFKKNFGTDWNKLPSKVVFQLNDTHPAIAPIELMRLLIDSEDLSWEQTKSLFSKCFAYTNHTVLPEALENWDIDLFKELLPRHLEIINQLNHEMLEGIKLVFGNDCNDLLKKISVFEEKNGKFLCMARLAVIGCFKVNGVAALHSQLVKDLIFPEFVSYYNKINLQNKFINITNGVTPRRWIHNANRSLSELYTKTLGSENWLTNLDLLKKLNKFKTNADFISSFKKIKFENKLRFAKWLKFTYNITINPNMLLDVQVKRIHEYKRQQLNIFYLIHRYLEIKSMTPQERMKLIPRCSIIGGKAAPGYYAAKTIIKLITSFSELVNNDPDVNSYVQVYFLPNYNVTSASLIIPASDINQQISTAGMEASGTGNMKFVMNGSLIVGTMDGATVEIVEQCGEDTAFIFGAFEHEVANIRQNQTNGLYNIDFRLKRVFDWINEGHLGQNDEETNKRLNDFVNSHYRRNGTRCADYFLLSNDFGSYIDAQNRVDETYKDEAKWWEKSINAATSMGFFSTDRTIKDYSELIWQVEPCL
uniref:Alpha-1,4 glucan phosphorylase n=1 Tax=Dermatophagoides pteronyssinus TaxID=6956 RepID=A0A6P6YA10_DERPT|nr:glycogen phosphorylase 1-like [Dermatophagoides pteronyssinus]